MSPIIRRLVSVAASAALAAAALVVLTPPASAFDPTDPRASCGATPAGSSVEGTFSQLLTWDTRYGAVDQRTLSVSVENGLRTRTGRSDGYKKPTSPADLESTYYMFDRGRFQAYSQPRFGSLSLARDGSFTYTPNFSSVPPDSFVTISYTDSFEYFFQYDDSCSNVAQVVFDVTPATVNRKALAAGDRYPQFDPRTQVTAQNGVLANDSTVDGQFGSGQLRAVLTSQLTDSVSASRGTVDLAADGSFRIQAAAVSPNPQVQFSYRACPIYMDKYTIGEAGCSEQQTVVLDLLIHAAPVDDVYDMPPGATSLHVSRENGPLANDPIWMSGVKMLPQISTADGLINPYSVDSLDGGFEYYPKDADAVTPDTFTYQLCWPDRQTCSPEKATVTINRNPGPRVTSVATPQPTSGDPIVIDLSEIVSGVSASNVVVTGPLPSTTPVPVSLACWSVNPPGGVFAFGAVFAVPCTGNVNRIVATPQSPLVPAAQYAVTLNPTGTDMPGTLTGIQLRTVTSTVTVTSPLAVLPGIVDQPADVVVRPLGDPAVFAASVVGYPVPTLQWQRSADGGSTWTDLLDKTGDVLVVNQPDAVDGAKYRLRASNRFGSVLSRVATLTVGNAPIVTLHPKDRTNQALVTPFFTLTAAAVGTPAPTVQWEVSLDHGQTWADVPGATTATATLIGAGSDGTLYRARFTNNAGTVRTDPAEIFVVNGFLERPQVTAAPHDTTAALYDLVTFTASATGATSTQWQWAAPGTDEFVDIDGEIGPSVTIQAEVGSSGLRMRAAFSNAAGRVYSGSALLSIVSPPAAEPPTITQQPTDVSVAEGATAAFSVVASGSPAPLVLWQTSTDGTTWSLDQVDVGSALVLGRVTAGQDGLRVRALALSSGGVAVSDVVELTVVPDPLPTLSLPATIDVPATSASGAVVSFAATASDNDPVAPTVTCTPASGSTFPVGETTVSCRAEDALDHEVTGSFLVRVAPLPPADTTGPVLAGPPTVVPAPNAAGWNTGPVTLTWSWSDPGTGVDPAACTTSSLVSASVTVRASCTDVAGNATTSPPTTVRIDGIAPTLAPVVPTTLLLGATASAVPGAADTGGSGLASSSCTAITTATLGTRSVTCTATDRAGNSTTATRSYTVLAQVSTWVTPPLSTFVAIRGTTLTARFQLAGNGGRLSSSVSAALATAKQVRVSLTGPRIAAGTPLTALCTWDTRLTTYACPLAIPKTLATGTRNPYTLTVELLTAPTTWTPAAGSKNKVTLYLL